MTLDEYEVIRLIDFEDFNQEQCAQQMGVSRTTVQYIYANARKKLAHCLVLGSFLHIEGGDVEFCDQHKKACGKRCCKTAARKTLSGRNPEPPCPD